jgi:sulfonate transport system ATP-binding protein
MIVPPRSSFEGEGGAVLAGRASGAEGSALLEPSAITLERVGYTYEANGLEALRDVTLEIPRHSVVGIVGPSGCGKSTLLALLANLKLPTAGRLTVRQFDKSRHPIAMMFQKDTLLPWLTVEQNVKLYYRIHRKSKSPVAADLVDELLPLAHLNGFRRAYPKQLSGGMRRRVAFLSTVAALPEILLLDEPFSSLDEPTRVGIHQDVHSIIRSREMTVILVTHDLAEAVSLCDEIIILSVSPGTVCDRHAVPFGNQRNMLDLRKSEEFLRLYGLLWDKLAQQIALGSGT